MDEQTSSSLIQWLDYSADDIRKGIDNKRFLFLFSRDYKYVIGDIICPNCKGFEKRLDLFKQKIRTMSKEQSSYRLKNKYDGIMGARNSEMTDKKAEDLAKKHPKGYGLFSQVPEKVQKELDAEAVKSESEKEKEAKHKSQVDTQNENEARIKAEEQRKANLKKEAAENKANRIASISGKSKDWIDRKAKELGLDPKSKNIAEEIYNTENKK